jgi:hypothetical protein
LAPPGWKGEPERRAAKDVTCPRLSMSRIRNIKQLNRIN